MPAGTDYLKFLGKSVVYGDWHWHNELQILSSAAAFSASVIVANEYGKGKTHDFILQTAKIQLACDASQDAGTIALGFNHLKQYPNAQKMLWHYLTGDGDAVEVDTRLVFASDEKLTKTVFRKINESIKRGKSLGSVNVVQSDYGNQEWRNAFGSINVHWTKSKDTLELWIEDIYQWHPDELRVTQCVHQAMDRAKKYGAKDFHYTGSKWTIKINANSLP